MPDSTNHNADPLVHLREWFDRAFNDECVKDWENDDVDELRRLLTVHPTLARQRDDNDKGPIDWTVEQWSYEVEQDDQAAEVLRCICELLLRAGADPNAGSEPPLFFVADPSQAALLLEHGADINIRNPNGDSPLMHAVRNPSLYNFLVSQGADPGQANNDRATAAAWREMVETGS